MADEYKRLGTTLKYIFAPYHSDNKLSTEKLKTLYKGELTHQDLLDHEIKVALHDAIFKSGNAKKISRQLQIAFAEDRGARDFEDISLKYNQWIRDTFGAKWFYTLLLEVVNRGNTKYGALASKEVNASETIGSYADEEDQKPIIKEMYQKYPLGVRFIARVDAYAYFTSNQPYSNAVIAQSTPGFVISAIIQISKKLSTFIYNQINISGNKVNAFSNSIIVLLTKFLTTNFYTYLPTKLLEHSREAEKFERYGWLSKPIRMLMLGLIISLIGIFAYGIEYEIATDIMLGDFIFYSEWVFFVAICVHQIMAHVLTKDIKNSPYNRMKMSYHPLKDDLYDEIIRPLKAVYNVSAPPGSRFPILWKLTYIPRLLLSVTNAALLLLLEILQAIKTLIASFFIMVMIQMALMPLYIYDAVNLSINFIKTSTIEAYKDSKTMFNSMIPNISKKPTMANLGGITSSKTAAVNLGYTPGEFHDCMNNLKDAPIGGSQLVFDNLLKARDTFLRTICSSPAKNEDGLIQKDKDNNIIMERNDVLEGQWLNHFQTRVEKGIHPDKNGAQLTQIEKLKDQIRFFKSISKTPKGDPRTIQHLLKTKYMHQPVPHVAM